MKKKQQDPEKSKKNLSEKQQLIQMNTALAESGLSYRSIFEHATDAIYIQDENGVYIDVDDSSVYIEVSMNPIVIDGEVVGVSCYGKDVTEKKQLKQVAMITYPNLLIALNCKKWSSSTSAKKVIIQVFNLTLNQIVNTI